MITFKLHASLASLLILFRQKARSPSHADKILRDETLGIPIPAVLPHLLRQRDAIGEINSVPSILRDVGGTISCQKLEYI